MRNLVSIDGPYFTQYLGVVSDKRDSDMVSRLIGIICTICTRYNRYEDLFTARNLVGIENSPFERNHGDLLHCYRSATETLNETRRQIRAAQPDDLKGTCQYCGMYKPNTFDHFLPISDYPEFSTHPLNLIPCCGECNGKKKAYWIDGGELGIINFYLNEVPTSRFLLSSVSMVHGDPVAKFDLININNEVEEGFFRVIERHFIQLELLKRYNDDAPAELAEIIRIILTYSHGASGVELSNNLHEDFQSLSIKFGANYWRAELRKGLSESESFINYVLQKFIV